MDPFVGPCRFSRGDRSLKVYDSKIDCGAVKFLQRIAPDVVKWQWTWYRAVGILCQSNVIARIAHIRFVQNWIHRMRQRLVNAAPGHYIAAEKQAHEQT